MEKNVAVALLFSICISAFSGTKRDSLVTHKAIYDKADGLLSWYKPDVPGAGYDKVVNLAADFIKNRCPIEPTTGLPLYMVHTWFYTPKEVGEETFLKGLSGSDDGHTPACTYANFVQSFVLKYFPYSGDSSYIGLVRNCLDRLIDHGTTPDNWVWANCPYASANPRSPDYFGATHWGVGGRNDGPFVIEPDKVGEIGIQYLNFYKVTSGQKYLRAAILCADALAKNVRVAFDWHDPDYRKKPFISPWPFRVSAENGQVHEEYTSNVIGGIALFDELIRLRERLQLDENRIASYQKARKIVWDWLYSTEGPMRTFVWKGYFEDIPNDPYNKNRNQISPMETARYLINHPEMDDNLETRIPALIYFVASAFEIHDMDGIREQFWCYAGMGSHAARYASICALWYERTKDAWLKEQAFRFFNWASYMCDENGYVIVGPDFVTQYWFTDGYGDYIRHFIEGLGAVPEWAPADEDHLLKSTSVVKTVSYNPAEIVYVTFDKEGKETLRLTSKPASVLVNGKMITERENLDSEGWSWEKLKIGGVLRILHQDSTVTIQK